MARKLLLWLMPAALLLFAGGTKLAFAQATAPTASAAPPGAVALAGLHSHLIERPLGRVMLASDMRSRTPVSIARRRRSADPIRGRPDSSRERPHTRRHG
jgi:hypothetical protein